MSTQGEYHNLSPAMVEAINRHEIFYLAVELYLPFHDDIFNHPEEAQFRFSDSRFFWRDLPYKDKIQSIPALDRFIGKEFNSLTLELVNVERLTDSGSRFVFSQLVRGFRVGVRVIFPKIDPQEVEDSRLIWWGRLANVEAITEKSVRVNCSQEIGDFSYELANQKYAMACPLWFGKGDCLGNELLTEKSPQYQAAFAQYGQGGCDRTRKRCTALANEKFYQGQETVTVTGQFFREEVERVKFLLFWHRNRINRIPVQWSSKSQSENSDVTIPRVLGRAKVQLHPITWADTGTEIKALLGGCKGLIQGFYNITCLNPNLTLQDITQHLGEFGGTGTQNLDPRFPQSGYNSRLAYLGATYGGSPPADEPEEIPDTTAVIKGEIVEATDALDNFIQRWSCSPVWLTQHVITNFQYTVVRRQWFNDTKNIQTADYCNDVVEDDTDAEQALVSATDANNYYSGEWTRYTSTSRISGSGQNVDPLDPVFLKQPAAKKLFPEVAPRFMPPIDENGQPMGGYWGDIWWGGVGGSDVPAVGQSRTYLSLRFTCNGVLNSSASLSDVLYSFILPTFRGYLRFNTYGKIDIDCRKPADNAWVRVGAIVNDREIGVTNVSKFIDKWGYLLIGVGKIGGEIGKIAGIRYVNGSAETVVEHSATGSITMSAGTSFEDRSSGPAELLINFGGTPTAGDRVYLKFTEPSGEVFEWDYFVGEGDTLEAVTKMFQLRLMASPIFRDTWTAEIFEGFSTRIYVRCQTGYVKLEEPLKNNHEVGEEIIRVVEVYEDAKDEVHRDGLRDNMKDFIFNDRKQEVFHGVKSTYISAIQDFRETEIQPRVSWDAAEQERNLHIMELDLRFVDSYRQAAWLTKSATIDFVDGNLYSSWSTGIRGMFHEEGDVVAVRHQTMQGLSYTPFTIETFGYDHASMDTHLGAKLYLSAAFDDRVAKEEKFFETSLTQGTATGTPPPSLSPGGYSTTGTGDGAGGTRQTKAFELEAYETLPDQQKYSPNGADRL